MADRNTTSDYMDMLLAGEPLPASATGSWDEPPPPPAPKPPRPSYLGTLLPRSWINAGDEGNRLLELGQKGIKEQGRTMYGVGPLVDAEDARQRGDYWAAAGNVGRSALDLAGGAGAKKVTTGVADLGLKAWQEALDKLPSLRTERAAEELAKITPKRAKPGSAAQTKRVERSEALAERALPEPATPGGISAEEAARRVGVIDNTLPGNALAATIAGVGATGIPGIVVDDIKGATIDPLNAMRKEQIEENRAEKQLRASPTVEGGKPEVDSYWKQLDTLRHERNMHAGFASGMGAAGGPGAYATMKSVPWAASRIEGGLLGLAAQAALIHPALGLLVAGGALAPLAVPAALGTGTWGLAKGTAGQIDQALLKHEKVKALAPVVRQLADNYRADQQSPPSLTPDQAY